jgi:hypothetical protein
MASKAEIKSFLQELKQVIKIWPIFFVDRDKNNIQVLASLEITANRREEIISNLEIEDYHQGPLEDKQYNGKGLWIFGKIIKKQELYIKLTLVRRDNRVNTICISFHEAMGPLSYPYRPKL